MKLVDVHCHLDHPRFENDLKEVLENAERNGVGIILNSGVNPESNRVSLKLSQKFPQVKASFGLYPIDSIAEKVNFVGSDDLREIRPFSVDKELEWIEANKDHCFAIGEIGLDFQVAPNFKAEQIEVFEKILDFAKKLDKVVVIHSRKAEKEAIDILEKKNVRRVIMHCFSGKKSLIKRCIEKGWFFSIPPVIKRLDHFKSLVEMTPLDNLLTETDSPYLSPVLGIRNEPSNVVSSIQEISKIKELKEELVAQKIFENFQKLFRL